MVGVKQELEMYAQVSPYYVYVWNIPVYHPIGFVMSLVVDTDVLLQS
jgi:hypothetical protein